MEALNIRDNESFLRQKSIKVDLNDKELKNDIIKVRNFLKEHTNTLALAPVQIGIPKRFIYIKHTDLNDTEKIIDEGRILINPVMIERIGLTKFWEACASCNDATGLVKRPYKIKINYQDINGNYIESTLEGEEATVFSHEYDHLDGILHIDLAEKIITANYEERKELRKKEPYQIINTTDIFEDIIKTS